jgi:hypothetical protein
MYILAYELAGILVALGGIGLSLNIGLEKIAAELASLKQTVQ